MFVIGILDSVDHARRDRLEPSSSDLQLLVLDTNSVGAAAVYADPNVISSFYGSCLSFFSFFPVLVAAGAANGELVVSALVVRDSGVVCKKEVEGDMYGRR